MTLAPLADPFCFLDEHLVVFFVFIEAMFGFTPAVLSSCCHLEAETPSEPVEPVRWFWTETEACGEHTTTFTASCNYRWCMFYLVCRSMFVL